MQLYLDQALLSNPFLAQVYTWHVGGGSSERSRTADAAGNARRVLTVYAACFPQVQIAHAALKLHACGDGI